MTMNSSTPPADLSPKHVRAARALLAWSQQELAKAAGVATSTVADFERGQRTPVANNAQAIRGALEGAGIRFLATGAIVGPSVPIITTSDRPGAPVRWVSAEDLCAWANRTDGAVSLPTLLAQLIQATHGSAARLRFPSDEGVRYSGWDGRTSSEVGSKYVPKGEAGWEIGVQRSNIAQKASEDYRKRTEEPAPLNPADAAYVFVTPRHWPKKDEWAKARQEEGPWREVRVYDADDLVHWIEQTPAVGLWLATRLDKRPPGTRELEEVWKEWSLATQWPLTEDLVLSDRDQDAAEVLRWLRGATSVLSLRTTTAEEVVAFFHAALSELPDEMAAAYRARCLVATTAAAARALANAPEPLILLLTDPEPGVAQALAEKGHYVLQAYDERSIGRGEVRTLARPSREGIASALVSAGITEPRAKALARDSARNLAVLRRLIPGAPGRLPRWAEESPPRALLVALLAGGWDENAEADRARLSELADQSYEEIVAALAPYVGEFDSPLQKIGSTWRIASPSDAWFLLAHNLTSTDITRFEAAAQAVLGSADPRFDLDPDERWMAAVRGVHREYSGMLRHGIGQVLILLALWGDRVRIVSDASRRVDAIVAKLLRNADHRRWWSLSNDFRLLAEASPGAFLTAIEDSLDQDDPPIGALFGHDGGGAFGTEHLSDLMWALESLAWSPDWMPRVTHILARLDAIDTKPRHYSNGPANSLREIHLLWMPQTYATLDQRLRALDLIRKHETNAAWKLMLGILPQGHDSSIPSPAPLWRDFTVDEVETVTWGLIGRGAAAISERLLADVGLNPERWSSLLDRLGDLAPGTEKAIAALETVEPKIADKADRRVLWDKLRGVLHHHRQFPDAEWSLTSAVLDRLECLYNGLAPTDPLEQIAWLFQQQVQLSKPSSKGWEAEQRDVDTARQQAVQALYASEGLSGILSLARLVETAGYIGKALYDSGLPADDIDALLATAVRSDDAHERDVAHGLIISLFRDQKEPWAGALIAKARAENWGNTALLTILRALPTTRWTWDQVAQIDGELEAAYWRLVPVFWMDDNSEDVAYAIRMLIGVGRARHALPLAAHGSKVHLPSELLIEVLQEAARQPFDSNGDSNEATMFQHYVAEILQLLDARDDADRNALITLEWNYLQVLEHSRRPAKALLKALSEDPSLFIMMLSAVYKASEESGVIEPEPEDPEQARAVATQAYRLLGLWNRIPGTREDGTIDADVLESWIKEARTLAKAAGREEIADSRIGNMLSASPMGADGNWPAEPVREMIDLFRSKPMIDGFRIGKSNRRGVTSRSPGDGGKLERIEAAKYRAWAKALSYEHPHTAKALDALADDYDWQARREDEEAERRDWEA
ncbi:XRE family transcriptional regulator [Rhodanobacter sp. FW510-R12]|uniref:helix-turn-helix domain-containing protein n=1 Tax=unclassified Rhodanobacter TaxID=2621553 RepID=UPI0007A9ACCD|nr:MULTISPECIES: helix-turn-helix transcriptional regulator [unclassified Rhodanobacter]KZC15892.1 XRE family transcriptional regulator [Rhodanobacter sp. FW104-R8]KZC28294.1 XRE family transcriptional regulator [Rhodanobacter sp. FW510-T8]KZC32669.1 XRE family transcriptional regulator [Rhodanobacter sp. FW510-R10]